MPFVYRFYPLVREARARVAADFGPLRLIHGTYLQDWLSTEEDDNWRVDPAFAGPSRAFADIGSHWCDLVEFVTGDRLAAVCAELVDGSSGTPRWRWSRPRLQLWRRRQRNPSARSRPRTSPSSCSERSPGVTGSVVISQISSGRKNRLFLEVTGAEATMAFDQEQPETLWVGRRRTSEIVPRDPAYLRPAAAAYATVPPGHPQGYQDCFDAFVADSYRAVEAGSADVVDGLPTFADGVRAALITDAVLRSASSHRWEDVEPPSAPNSKEVRP